MLKRRLRLLAILAVALLLAAGCSKAPTRAQNTPAPQTAAPEADTETDTDTVRLAVDPDTAARPKLDAVTAAFQAAHPRYRVQPVSVSQRVDGKELEEKLKRGDVDLYQGTGRNRMWMQDGLVTDLSPLVQKSGVDMTAFTPMFSELQHEGRLIELPYSVEPVFLVVNKDLAREAGVKLPEGTWTWEEFDAAARKLTFRKQGEKVWGLAAYGFTLTLPRIRMAQAISAGAADDAAARDSLKHLGALVMDGISPSYFKTEKGAPPPPPDYFRLGQAGMSILRLSQLFGTENPLPFEWDVLPMPLLPGARPVTFVYLESYSIPTHSDRQEAAWAFLSFMTGPEGAMALAKAGQMPYRLTAETKKAFLEARPNLPPTLGAALEKTAWITYPYFLDDMTRPGILWINARKVLAEEIRWEEAAANYAASAAKLSQTSR